MRLMGPGKILLKFGADPDSGAEPGIFLSFFLWQINNSG